MTMRYFTLLFLLFICCSCAGFFDQELPGDDRETPLELSLFSLLQPQDSLLIVDVRRTISSQGGLSTEEGFNSNLAGVEVSVSNGAEAYPLAFSTQPGLVGYVLDLQTVPDNFLQPGGSYTVRAQFGQALAEASTEIPLDSLARDDVRFLIDEQQDGTFTETTLFTEIPYDPAGYYVLTINREFGNGRRSEELIDFRRGADTDGIRTTFNGIEVFDGQVVTVRVCVTNEATYDFLNARSIAIGNSQNPFAEATILPSNVAGGVGHVGGLNCQLFRFQR